MTFHHARLANGLEVIAELNDRAYSVASGFFVKTGSRDESTEVAGVSHFLEHMVFKGTPRRDALAVNRDFDRVGAKHNAQTSEEDTFYHVTCLPEYLPPSFDVLSDILRPLVSAQADPPLSAEQLAHIMSTATLGFKESASSVEQLRQLIKGLSTVVLAGLHNQR